jgi:hypothetical protein
MALSGPVKKKISEWPELIAVHQQKSLPNPLGRRIMKPAY